MKKFIFCTSVPPKNFKIAIEVDKIYAIAEMDKEEVVVDENGEVMHIPPHTRIFTKYNDFRVRDSIINIVDDINQVNKNEIN